MCSARLDLSAYPPSAKGRWIHSTVCWLGSILSLRTSFVTVTGILCVPCVRVRTMAVNQQYPTASEGAACMQASMVVLFCVSLRFVL